MININGYLIEEEEDVKIDTKYTIYPFSLCTRWDKRTLYSLKAEERKLWVGSIRSVLCYSDIYKTYDLGVRVKTYMKRRNSWEAGSTERCEGVDTKKPEMWWQSRF